MKQAFGWWFPDHEKHLPEWMAHPKNDLTLHGRRAYQGKKQLAALALVKQRRVAIDVGGHVGLWSYNLAHEFGEVYAFEPMASHRECFHANIPPDKFPHVHLRAMALGAEAGSVRLESEQGSSGNTAIAGKGDIPMATLDSLDLDPVDLIKIDCEGYEQRVIEGAEQTINRCRPVIVVEQKRDMASSRFGLPTLGAVALLQSWGYRIAQEISGDYIMVPA